MSVTNLCQARISNRLSQRLRTDKRRELRNTIRLLVRVVGDDGNRQWRELAETVNVSSGGAALRLSKRVMIGDTLLVELALPARFQRSTNPSATYRTYALVRFVEMREGEQIVRLQFLRS